MDKIISNNKRLKNLASLQDTFFNLSIAGYPDFTAHEFG
jgi:hypothetical protein